MMLSVKIPYHHRHHDKNQNFEHHDQILEEGLAREQCQQVLIHQHVADAVLLIEIVEMFQCYLEDIHILLSRNIHVNISLSVKWIKHNIGL